MDDCDPNARCDNTEPFYTCTCYDGYKGNGTMCTGKYNHMKNVEL